MIPITANPASTLTNGLCTYVPPENDQYYPSTTQQEVYSPTVSVPMSSPQNDQYYASAIQQEVHSQIVLPPSTQENILIQALKEIV
ncbi:hypothetical protein EVAR_61336_1 [Eumeta japonica]|uniref:Uncharacterized protein n=1 Tax=Eumeta variegata TaxID=151549 RepID=A0A4C1XZU7_EUMVA|nr:hypothetical protein EVAR_61336_1 [Eumeta japonica]